MRQDARWRRAHARARLRAVAAALVGLILLVAVVTPRSVEAETLPNGYSDTFFVNDLRTLADTTPGDGICATTSVPQISGVSSCTLRAAIQEANALADTNTVLIVPAAQMRTFAGAMVTSGLINLNTSSESGSAPDMLTSSTSPTFVNAAQLASTIDGDLSARYWIAQPGLTLDFQNRLGFSLPGDSGTDAIILATGSNQTIRNFSNLTSAEGGIYVGGSAVSFTLENGFLGNSHGASASTADYAIERALVVVEGAANTVVRNVTFERNYTDAVLLVPGSSSGAQIDGLTVTRSTWGQPQNGGGFDPVYNYFVRNWNSLVSGRNIAVTENDIRNWSQDGGGTDVIQLSSGTWSNVVISGNTFTNTTNTGVNPIQINSITASNVVVERNLFTNTVAQSLDFGRSSIYLYYSGGVTVRDNQIVGGGQAVSITTDGGTLVNPVVRTTMSGVGGTPTAANENGASTANNIWNLSNNQIRTTYPTAATIVTSPPASCLIDVTVAPPTTTGGNAITGSAVWVDVFIGPSTGVGLDQHLGRLVTTVGALPTTVRLPYTGAGTGSVVRVQTTEVSTGRTSAYSRTVAASGADACGPQLWVKQGGWARSVSSTTATQSDPTTGREVAFDIRASEAPGTNGLVAGDITFSGTAPGQQVVSLTQITPTSWRLVTRATGSGTIVPVIAAGAVNDAAGLTSSASNTTGAPIDFAGFTDAAESVAVAGPSIDSSVTYQAPLELTVSTAAVTEGGSSANLTIGYTASAMSGGIVTTVPQYDLVLTPTLSGFTADPSMPTPTPAQTAAGVLSASTVTMTSSVTSADLPVTAINNTVVDGTRSVSLAYTVSSSDPEFDGLVVRSTSGALASVTIADNDAPSSAQSTLAVAVNNALANGTATNEVTATVRNTSGQLVANALVSIAVPAGVTHQPVVGSPTAGPATIQVVTDASGLARVPLTSITAGTAFAIAGTVPSGTLGGSPRFVTFTGLPADASQSRFGVSTGTVTANGLASHVVTIDLRSSTGQPVSADAASISVSASPSTGVTVGSVVETSTAGTYRALVSSTVATTVTMAARLGATPITTVTAGLGTTATFVAGTVDLTQSTVQLVTNGSTIIANGTEAHVVRVVARDANGNPVAGVSVVASGSDDLVFSDATTITDAAGVALVDVTTVVAGSHSVTVTIGGSAPSGTPVTATFVAGAADAAASQFSVSAGEVEANGIAEHWARVLVTDAFGNPVSGATVTFDGAPGLVLSAPSAVSNTEGIARVDLTSSAAGTYAISADLAAVTVGASTVTFAVGAPSAAQSSWSVSPGTAVVADGVDAHTATVTVRDGIGNLVPSAVVSFSAPVGVTIPAGPHVTDAFGQVSVPLTSTSAGGFVVVAFLGANQIGAPATLDFVAGSPSTWLSTISATPLVVEADGVDTTDVTVTLVDAYSNPILVGGASVIVTTDRGSASPVTDRGDGSYTATVTSLTGGPADVGFTVAGVPAASQVSVEFVATPAAPVVGASNGALVAGSAAPGLHIDVTDAAGTPLCSTVSDLAGAFQCAPSPAPADGETLRVTATDEHGFASAATVVTVDAVAPAAPLVDPSAGGVFSGTAEPFSTITITSGTDLVCTATTSAGGAFGCSPVSGLADGEVVSIIATDDAGNASAPTIVTVDADVPQPPVVDPSSGAQISGSAEPGSTVVVTDDLGAALCSTTAAGDGSFACAPSPVPAHGDVVTIVATDEAGNASPPSTITIDSVAPAAPVVDPTNGAIVSAAAEPASTLQVRLLDGTVLCTTVVAATGRAQCTPLPRPVHGTTLVVTATDAAGNESSSAIVVVDAVAPAAPSVAPTDGSTVVGTAEPAAEVTVSGPGPVVLCTTTADGAGAFSCPLTPAVADSTPLSITATDAAGNTSTPTTVTSHSALPPTPVLNPSDGTRVTGTASAGGTVTVITTSGSVLCTTTATVPSGSFSCSLSPAAAHATVLRVTVTDSFDLTSAPAQVTVDSVAPTAPVLNLTDGRVVTGRAEPNSRVEVRDDAGTLIGTATTAGSGAFAVTLTTPQPVGAIISATATDAAGNESSRSTLRVGTPWMEMSEPQLVPGETQTITGYDFQPGELTTLSIDGVGTNLAQQYADSNGRVQFTITIPAGTPGGLRDVLISAAVSGQAVASFETVSVELAQTGRSASVALWVALALLLIGAGVVALRLIRRPSAGARHRSASS